MNEHIRIIHTADLHIGTQNYGKTDPTTGLHTRLLDFLKTFDELIDHAIDNEIDIVLICGDIFKSREPDVTQQREFAKRIKRLSQEGIVVYIVIGNHDLHNASGKATSVEIYDIVGLQGIYIKRRPGVDIINTKRGKIQLVALPYVTSANLTCEGMSIEEISLEMRKKLNDLTERLAAEIDNTLPAVLASHYSLIGADSGSEKGIMLGREVTLPVSMFERSEYNYVAMGHIHKHQKLGNDPPVVYSGSLDRVDFSEENEDKGFVELFVKKGEALYNFVKLSTRPFKTIFVDASSGDPFNKSIQAIEEIDDLSKTIVKLRVSLEISTLHNLNESELYKLLRQDSFYVAGIEKIFNRDTSHLRHPGLTERMDAKQALSEYISKKEDYSKIKSDLLRENEHILDEINTEAKNEAD